MDDVRDTRVESNLPFLAVVRILGIVVALFSLTMLLPLGFAFFGNDAALFAYDEAILITAVSGTNTTSCARIGRGTGSVRTTMSQKSRS